MGKRALDIPKENTSTLKDCKDFCKEHPRMRVIKVRGDAHLSGEPDLIGCVYDERYPHGLFFAIEIKRPGIKKPQPLQAVKLARWAEVKAITGVADDIESFIAIFYDHGITL